MARKPTQSKRKPQSATSKIRLPETDDGAILFNTDPIILKYPYHIDYIHSYAQDTPFFVGLSKGKLLGSQCKKCKYVFATPRSHCMECGAETQWHELPKEGRIHTFTICHYGSEIFLPQTPFILILVEFEGVDTLFLSRLVTCNASETERLTKLEKAKLYESQVRIGMKVKAQFVRNSKFSVTDVYFVPA
jgi:hypothetical protein